MSDYTAARPSGWAIGGVTFASTIMILVGIFQAFAGLAAIIDDEFYVITQNYAFDLDTTAWGWIHLILGIVVASCRLCALGPQGVGGDSCHLSRDAQRDCELLLHSVLPVLVDPDDRARRLGHLGSHATGSRRRIAI